MTCISLSREMDGGHFWVRALCGHHCPCSLKAFLDRGQVGIFQLSTEFKEASLYPEAPHVQVENFSTSNFFLPSNVRIWFSIAANMHHSLDSYRMIFLRSWCSGSAEPHGHRAHYESLYYFLLLLRITSHNHFAPITYTFNFFLKKEHWLRSTCNWAMVREVQLCSWIHTGPKEAQWMN